MRNAGLREAQAGIKIAGRNINNLRYADDTTLMAESEEELKGLLMKVKEDSEKVGLKLNIQKTKIVASGPITSWQIDGETVETVADFIFLGSKITADGECSHEIKRPLLLGRKVMINLESILKSRDKQTNKQTNKKQRHYFVNNGPSSQGYGFSSGHVWMWELDYKESWVQKNWCFWTVVLEKTLESPLDSKEIQPVHPDGGKSWVYIGRTDAEAETPVVWPPHAKSWLIGKRSWRWEGLGAGGEGDDRGWDGWMASLTRWTWVWVDTGGRWWTGRPGVLQFVGSQNGVMTERLNWAELNLSLICYFPCYIHSGFILY